MEKRKMFFFIGLISLFAMGGWAADGDLTDLVNPRIGTGGHGHVFLGANVPFGFVQLGPTQHTRGWDWCMKCLMIQSLTSWDKGT